MRVRIVNFRLEGMTDSEYQLQAEALAAAFNEWPGLVAKLWLADPASRTYGGVYLFGSKEDADRSRETELFQGMVSASQFVDLEVREFELLEEPSRISGVALLQSAFVPAGAV